MRFEGKAAIVTGGASGIGRATVQLLSAKGAAVAILDNDEVSGNELSNSLNNSGGRTHFFQVNVAQSNKVEDAVKEAHHLFGRIDALVVSAGIQRYGTAVTTSDAEWEHVLGINLSGAWYAARACLPFLKATGGSIVNVASVQSLATQNNVLAYTVSKHGMVGLTRSMAVDFAADGIRANAVCPGTVDTPMLRRVASLDPDPQSVIDACNAMHPLGRIATPEEIANVIVFLASDEASFVTGAVWTVDGGLLTRLGGVPRTGPSQREDNK